MASSLMTSRVTDEADGDAAWTPRALVPPRIRASVDTRAKITVLMVPVLLQRDGGPADRIAPVGLPH
jgi:hypothetical protein